MAKVAFFCGERPHSNRPRTGAARWQAHQVSRLINSTPIDGYRPFANKNTLGPIDLFLAADEWVSSRRHFNNKFFWKKCPRLSSYFYQAHVTIDVIENQINDNEMTHWHGLSSGAAIQVFFNFLHNRLKCLHVMKPISVSLSNKKSIN